MTGSAEPSEGMPREAMLRWVLAALVGNALVGVGIAAWLTRANPRPDLEGQPSPVIVERVEEATWEEGGRRRLSAEALLLTGRVSVGASLADAVVELRCDEARGRGAVPGGRLLADRAWPVSLTVPTGAEGCAVHGVTVGGRPAASSEVVVSSLAGAVEVEPDLWRLRQQTPALAVALDEGGLVVGVAAGSGELGVRVTRAPARWERWSGP